MYFYGFVKCKITTPNGGPQLYWLKRIAPNLSDLQLLAFGDNDGDLLGGTYLNDRGGLLDKNHAG